MDKEGSMACRCGGEYKWDKDIERLICDNCGLLAPYQPVDINKLLEENKRLKEQVVKLEKQKE